MYNKIVTDLKEFLDVMPKSKKRKRHKCWVDDDSYDEYISECKKYGIDTSNVKKMSELK